MESLLVFLGTVPLIVWLLLILVVVTVGNYLLMTHKDDE